MSWQRGEFSGFDHTDRIITAQAFVPLLLHVATHFFIGLGPTISRDIDSTERIGIGTPSGQTVVDPVKTTTIALQSVIGGWF